MVAKVNSGVFKDQVLAGSLRAFVIGGVTLTAGTLSAPVASADDQEWTLSAGSTVKYNDQDAVPDTAAEMVYRILSTRSTVVSIEFETVTDTVHVILENASGWGYTKADGVLADLEAELQGLGATFAVSVEGAVAGTGDFSAATAVENRMVFDAVNGAIAAPAVGGLGGNEHDQDTDSNAKTAP